MTRPKPRSDGRCWAGCGRYAAPVDLAALTDEERHRLETAPPRACWAHREQVEAELHRQINRYRDRRRKAATS